MFVLSFGLLLLALSYACAQSSFLLPTDAETFLKEPIKTQFRCARTGYFADIDNNCQMYHVCVVQKKATGHETIRQYSFVCGNGTIFNQLTMNCDDPDESLPCEDAPSYYKINEKIGERDTPLHTGNDWEENLKETHYYPTSEAEDHDDHGGYTHGGYGSAYDSAPVAADRYDNVRASASRASARRSNFAMVRPGVYAFPSRTIPFDG